MKNSPLVLLSLGLVTCAPGRCPERDPVSVPFPEGHTTWNAPCPELDARLDAGNVDAGAAADAGIDGGPTRGGPREFIDDCGYSLSFDGGLARERFLRDGHAYEIQYRVVSRTPVPQGF